MSHRLRHGTALGLCCLALVSACGGSGKVAAKVSDLAAAPAMSPGACRQSTGAVNTVHRDVAGLGADANTAAAARGSLAQATKDLQALQASAVGQPVATPLDELVQAVGFLRLGIDSHSWNGTLLTRTDDAAKRLVQTCRSG